MKGRTKTFVVFAFLMVLFLLIGDTAFAEEGAQAASGNGLLAIGAGVAVAVAAFGCALGQSRVAAAALESIGRNPSAAGKLFTPMILGLVFIEVLYILSFVVAYFLQGKV
ncbi:MAG: F0F1 ATP synthase subunit C [Candidatus Dadabacteria bacterium]|nr:MAG: F0F1 ATP synthase subunit C [Candidatus Dadabacteria bacterium]